MAKKKAKQTGNPAKNKQAGNQPKPSARVMKKLPPLAPGEQRRVLHVGCGQAKKEKLPAMFQTPEWQEIRLDINEKVNPHIVSDMLDMHAVKTGSMDGLFSSHNIEHLYPHQVPAALKEFGRVLKEGGLLVITMPDLQTVASYVAEGRLEEPLYTCPAGPISPIDILYGWRKEVSEGNHFMAHKGGFTAKSLAGHLLNAGFSGIRVHREWVNLWAMAYRYPKDHPKFNPRVEVLPSNLRGSQGQKTPLWYERQIQMAENPEALTDALDVAPVHYKPVFGSSS